VPNQETTRNTIGLVLIVWGAALFCFAALDWAGYERFFLELFYGTVGP
jgi:hypothetical protein